MTHHNIIHFHAESWDGRMISPLGHPALRHATPNIQRLTQAGTFFPNAYCSHPICCPSRANMWSGTYSHTCESWNNNKGLEEQMWSLIRELPATHTFQNFGKLDYLTGGHSLMNRVADWLTTSGIQKPVFDKTHAQCFTVADDDSFRYHANDWKLADQALAFLEEQRASQAAGGKPFFLTLSPNLVHASFRTNRYWLEKIPADLVDIPAHDPCDHPCRRYQQITKGWQYGFEDDTVRQVRRIYMAMCAEADALVGYVYDAMHRLGLADNTYFVFTSDHGEMAMEHQDWFKMSLYEASVRVPMIMTGPGVVAGQRLPNLVSLVDLCPTFMDMAGLAPRPNFDGQSLMPLLTGQTRTSRDTAYACYMSITMNTSAFMLRKGRWKYIVYVGYPCQLFDLETDPGELKDLSSSRPEIVRQLDAELRSIVDYQQTHRDVVAYNKDQFRQWRRQARRGIYIDDTYALEGKPSSDYWAIMDNVFTGYNQEDEAKVEQWLNEGEE